MLCQLSTVKTRLSIVPEDTTYDAILTAAIQAVSARFDRECNRTFARAVGAKHEFPADAVHVPVPCYPVETITKFEIQTDPTTWLEVPSVSYVLRSRSVLSLPTPLISTFYFPNFCFSALARVTYTGGYVLPGDPPLPAPSTSLPADLEQSALEQVVFWYQTRSTVGIIRSWPSGGIYIQYADPDLIPSVRSVLRRHTRILL